MRRAVALGRCNVLPNVTALHAIKNCSDGGQREVTLVSRMTLWRKANPEKAKLAATRDYQRRQQRGYFRNYRGNRRGLSVEQRLRQQILELLGSKCTVCSFSDPRALQIDHINGNGYRERQGTCVQKRYRHILEIKGEGYQLLCANCNQIKKYINKENRK